VRERVATAAAPLHDRRRRLVAARESTLRDLGGLMLEMYKRNRFREELLLDKCEEVLAIEVEVAHVDQRLFQLAPPNAAGMRPIGRCECGAPIHPGQNFCGVCGRGFSTLTQARACTRCGSGLRAGDQFCGTCGHEAPDMLQSIEAPGPGASSAVPAFDAAAVAASAVADTIIIEAPPLDEAPTTAAASAGSAATGSARDTVTVESPATPPIEAPETPAPDAGNDRGFDWSAPPVIPDAAIDAALESPAAAPGTSAPPFSGFPLNATMPPPPVADPTMGDAPLVTPVMPTSTPAEAAPSEEPAPKPTAASQRQRIKDAKARAKERAKAARAARKRGDA
jgi:hypothetical protein